MMLSRRSFVCYWYFLLLVWLPVSRSFLPNNVIQTKQHRHTVRHFLATSSDNNKQETNQVDDSEWKRPCGLLISSFTDGLLNNQAAHDVLRRGLVRSLLLDALRKVEGVVQSSATFSPCCGPTNLPALAYLEQLDDALRQLDKDETQPLELLEQCFSKHDTKEYCIPTLRVSYIPTAMYALRLESQNTPGKQRQRARADAKNRRDELLLLIEQLMTPSNIPIQICTVDWEDGSVKQPQQTEPSSSSLPTIPSNGKQVLGEWSPHLVYVQGGNTFWLHHCMKRGNWDENLLQLLDSGTFYIGSSAGAILAGQWIQTAGWKQWDDPRVVPGMEKYEDWERVAGLGLIGEYSVFCHYEEEQWSTLVEEKSGAIGGRRHLMTIRDDQVVHVNGRKQRLQILSSTSQDAPVSNGQLINAVT